MSNKTYDVLKWIALIFLPALGTAYFGLAGLWALPRPNEIVGTITIVDTFLGVLLGLSSNNYEAPVDGTIRISGNPEDDLVKLELDHDLESMAAKGKLNINVEHHGM